MFLQYQRDSEPHSSDLRGEEYRVVIVTFPAQLDSRFDLSPRHRGIQSPRNRHSVLLYSKSTFSYQEVPHKESRPCSPRLPNGQSDRVRKGTVKCGTKL